jgi:hypothetical protein
MAELPEAELARSLLVALRTDFAEREATALQLAELLLDAIAAAIPLTRHQPADAPLSQFETLAQQVDVFAWEGAPGWDVVLQQGLAQREPLPPNPSVLDGLGTQSERAQVRGELKRRARAEADRLIAAARQAGPQASGLRPRDTEATHDSGEPVPALSGSALVEVHASLLRLVGCACVSSLVLLPEDPQAGALPLSSSEALLREMDERGENFATAQDEWLALLLKRNPAAAQAPAFRTFYAGLSQSLRVALALREFRDAALEGVLFPDCEALLGAPGTWQPARWPSLRKGAPSSWFAELCPAAPVEDPLQRLARECTAGLDLFSRLWFAQDLSLTGFTALAAFLVARCASAVALWEELGGGVAAR